VPCLTYVQCYNQYVDDSPISQQCHSTFNKFCITACPQSSAIRRSADILDEIEKSRAQVRSGKDPSYANELPAGCTAADGKVSAEFEPVQLFVTPKLPDSVLPGGGMEALEQARLKRSFGHPELKASELPAELAKGTVLATNCGGGSGSGGGMYWEYNYYVQHEGDVYCVSLAGNDHNGQRPPSVTKSTLSQAKHAGDLTLAGKRIDATPPTATSV
jgi:hypothetical protein